MCRTFRSEIYKLILSIWNKEELPEGWKDSITVPTYKKDDKTNCSNCKGKSLLPAAYQIVSNILLSRLFCVRHIRQKREYNEALHQLFIDFKKAYDSLRREDFYNTWYSH
jgi:hypothetical protein